MELTPRKIALHSGLFVITLITTTLSAADWVYGIPLTADFSFDDFLLCMNFSVPFLLFLTVHEFGHYFAAMYHRVRSTLPYFIPLPPGFFFLGTLGAVIRLKSRIPSKSQTFDIGISGPLAGFVVAFLMLIYAYATLPPADYVFQFHPDYAEYGMDYAKHVYNPENMRPGVLDVQIGKNLLMVIMEKLVADPERIPNAHELMHYPVLLAAFLALLFTALNLMPVGQLDGGHVLYGLFGFKRHRIIASVFFVGVVTYCSWGIVHPGSTTYMQYPMPHVMIVAMHIAFLFLCMRGLRLGWKNELLIALAVFAIPYTIDLFIPGIEGNPAFILFALFISQFSGVPHPPSEIEAPLTPARVWLGWLAVLIFILCFTPSPINIGLST